VHVYILGPKLLRWNFFKSAIYTKKLCAQTFPTILGFFAIFDRNLAIIVAPSRPSDENENRVALLKNVENCIKINL